MKISNDKLDEIMKEFEEYFHPNSFDTLNLQPFEKEFIKTSMRIVALECFDKNEFRKMHKPIIANKLKQHLVGEQYKHIGRKNWSEPCPSSPEESLCLNIEVGTHRMLRMMVEGTTQEERDEYFKTRDVTPICKAINHLAEQCKINNRLGKCPGECNGEICGVFKELININKDIEESF